MAQTVNVTWVQGQDLDLNMIYKEGADSQSAVAKDLSSGYSVRMDVVGAASGTRLYTFNSAAIADVDPLQGGAQPDSQIEATLSSGAGSTPNIAITVFRTLTLPGGELYSQIAANPPVLTFFSDIFLRDTVRNKQWKVVTLVITVEKSYTLWQ